MKQCLKDMMIIFSSGHNASGHVHATYILHAIIKPDLADTKAIRYLIIPNKTEGSTFRLTDTSDSQTCSMSLHIEQFTLDGRFTLIQT